jgi:hypothetical protein
MQISHSLRAVKRGLGSGVPNALQQGLAWNRNPRAEQFGKQARLIESAFPLASWMQRYGHNYVKMPPAKTFIIKRRAKPTRHKMSQMNLAAVLKIVNDLADDTATAVRSHCCIKVNGPMSAVRACERSPNGTFERLGALLTKRRNDPYRPCFALLAEMFARSSLSAAKRAYGWVKKRRGRFEQFKLAKREHVSPKCALLPR